MHGACLCVPVLQLPCHFQHRPPHLTGVAPATCSCMAAGEPAGVRTEGDRGRSPRTPTAHSRVASATHSESISCTCCPGLIPHSLFIFSSSSPAQAANAPASSQSSFVPYNFILQPTPSSSYPTSCTMGGRQIQKWDPAVHEDILIAIFQHVNLSTVDWSSIMGDMRSKGYTFTEGALRYAQCLFLRACSPQIHRSLGCQSTAGC